MWLEDSISSLVELGHDFNRIPDYTLPQFMIALAAAERRAAARRLEFITDMSSIVGALFSGGDSIAKHISSLDAFTKEENYNGGSQ